MTKKTRLKKAGLTMVDLDGTLIQTKSGATFSQHKDDWEFIPGAIEAIKRVRVGPVVIVTNQGGIGAGFVKEEDFIDKVERVHNMAEDLFGLVIIETYYSTRTDGPSQKPSPHFAFWACAEATNHQPQADPEEDEEKGVEFIYYPSRSIMIGDADGSDQAHSDCDKKFAENAGASFISIRELLKDMRDG